MAQTLNSKLFREAKKYLVAGVNSPVRSFKAVGGAPVFIRRGKGAKIYDEKGRGFIDYCLSWGALILGHAHPQICAAIKKTIDKGSSFGAATKNETELAGIICRAIPAMEKVRLVNSGTEAVMGAIRLARAYTKRVKIIKFAGSYHGHADYLLESKGIPRDFTKHTLVCSYNDIGKFKALAHKHQGGIAAVIVEPVAANMGVVLPEEGFLEGLREVTREHKIVLIFDEVITGFRLSYGGAQKLFKIAPELTCLGKIIGGGMPCGAFGGRKEIMNLLSPQGPVYQAGTFSGNPLTVNAGLATLKILAKGNPYQELEKLSRGLTVRIKQAAQDHNIKLQLNAIGSMFSLFFTDKKVVDYADAMVQDEVLFRKFYHGLLEESIYFSPSGFETNFLSLAHTRKDVDLTLSAVEKAFKNLRER